MRRKKKIFKPKRHYKIKRRNENAVKIIAGAAAVAALIFVGYSVAGPIGRYIASRPDRTETQPWTPTDTDIVTDDTAAQTAELPAVTDITQSDISLPVSEEAQTSAAAVTEPAETTVTTVSEQTAALRDGGAAYYLDPDSMSDADSLDEALDELAASGCNAVIFPVKTEGGVFHYRTELDLVATVIDGNDPIQSELPASDIVKAAESRGLRPVALMSVLYDNNRYGDYRDGSYRSEDGDTWLDTSPDKGGKPWLSPFDETAQKYLCDIVTELGEAGFDEIICDDFIFPEFRSSDIDMLGEEVSPYSDRYQALTSLAVMMNNAGNDAGTRVMLRITANSVIRGYSELFYPDELEGCRIMIDYSENNISRTMVAGNDEVILDDMDMYDKITAVYGEVSSRCGDLPVYPMLDRESMSADDFDEAVKALTAMGYDEYYVY
ncbi:MAG: putative glycoside hydrolase [Oscillospiraceae bacterium]|nr:putative glycoside hydrolase [Oscillospiraceae bacterium]MDD7278141.1 putative glycoside hydrolase [Oscillospiraceae bacterium]MDY2864844.1 putative glycoside hydrolase [Oscillospiraceae bacterium]